jgi:ABC-type antimicrobial peptide transport system permease subunit
MDAIGRRIRLTDGKPGPWLRVVGVVNDVEPAYQIGGVDSWPKMQIYVPYGWDPAPMITLVARSRSDPSLAAMPVRDELRRLDQGVPIYDLLTLDRVLKMVQWVPRLWSQSFSLFGALALFIAAMGSYAVTSYSVSRRTREMASRIALGAEPKRILQQIVRQGLLTGGAGVVLGLAGAVPSCRFLATLLYDVSPNDPFVFGGVAFLMLVVAMLAAYLPARRAAHLDPATMLRSE